MGLRGNFYLFEPKGPVSHNLSVNLTRQINYLTTATINWGAAMFAPRGAVGGRVERESGEKEAVKWKNESLQATRQKAETDLNMKRETNSQTEWDQCEPLQLNSLNQKPWWNNLNLLSMNLSYADGFLFLNVIVRGMHWLKTNANFKFSPNISEFTELSDPNVFELKSYFS